MIYMLAVYLVYKGVEIFQIALMSNRANRGWGLLIGSLAIGFAVLAGAGFSIWADQIASSISDRMNTLPNLQR